VLLHILDGRAALLLLPRKGGGIADRIASFHALPHAGIPA
jgi:hypothetical protein